MNYETITTADGRKIQSRVHPVGSFVEHNGAIAQVVQGNESTQEGWATVQYKDGGRALVWANYADPVHAH